MIRTPKVRSVLEQNAQDPDINVVTTRADVARSVGPYSLACRVGYAGCSDTLGPRTLGPARTERDAMAELWAPTDVPRLAGTGPPLALHDTSANELRVTSPGATALMYVCGMTPYDATHLGHAATYLAFDLVNRVWRDLGHTVHYVQNITDVDDPLLERAARDREDWRTLGQRETDLFRRDMGALRVVPPAQHVSAVEAIEEIAEFVACLLRDGTAYRIEDTEHPDIYFDIRAAPRFGELSGYDAGVMRRLDSERGGDPERRGKRSPLDPLLWRAASGSGPWWDSDVGSGRPGWHVQCAAIAINRLGARIDLNGGGSDLIFPHHEGSVAHAEAFSGLHPFARHYVHAGMIHLGGKKMSKSRGNLVLVSDLLAMDVDPNAVRLALLAGHYRSDRSWSERLLGEAERRLEQWRRALGAGAGPPGSDLVLRIRTHLADDLDTPRALAAMDAWADETLTSGGTDATAPALVREALDALLGLTFPGT